MRARDDVGVRQHVAIGGEDDAGARAGGAAARGAPDADDGGADLLDDVDDGARVRVEELFVASDVSDVDSGQGTVSLAGAAARLGSRVGAATADSDPSSDERDVRSWIDQLAHAMARVKDPPRGATSAAGAR